MISARRGVAWPAALALALAGAAAGEGPGRRALTGDDARRAGELQRQVDVLMSGGKFAEAVRPAEEVLALRQRVQGERHWETVEARVLRDLLKDVAALPPAGQRDALAAGRQFAAAERLHQQGRYAETEPPLRRAVAALRQALGERHPFTADGLTNLAISLEGQGKSPEAELLFRQALAVSQKVWGERHPHTAGALNNLASSLSGQGRPAEAEPLFRRALAINREVQGEGHPDAADNLNNLAASLEGQGRYGEAEPLFREALRPHPRGPRRPAP